LYCLTNYATTNHLAGDVLWYPNLKPKPLLWLLVELGRANEDQKVSLVSERDFSSENLRFVKPREC